MYCKLRVLFYSLTLAFLVISMPAKGIFLEAVYSKPKIENGRYYQAMIISGMSDIDDYTEITCPRNSCYVGLAITDFVGGVPAGNMGAERVIVGPLKFDKTSGPVTKKEIYESVKKNHFPFIGTVSQRMDTLYYPICVGFVMQVSRSNETAASILDRRLFSCSDGSGGGGMTPPPPPPTEQPSCSIVEPQVTLNHSTLEVGQLNNNSAVSTVTVQCSKKANVKVYFSPAIVRLDSNGNLKSSLYVNGYAGSANLDVSNTRYVSLSSILSYSGTGNLSGVFNGSSVLIVDVM